MDPGNFDVAVKAMNALRRNRVLAMLIDMPHERLAVKTRWLDGDGYFSVGHAAVARAAGAPLLDLFIHRAERWTPQIIEIGTPFHVSGDEQEAVQLCAHRLETHIRRHPAEWRSFVNADDPRVVVRSAGHPLPLDRITEVISSHPGVLTARAVAVPDVALGTRVKAIVVPIAAGAVDAQALRDHCARLLPPYMVPGEVEFRGELSARAKP
jgi:acyl-CoA synthetase (AMP-forming)/AMP-acid ligase II